MAGRMLDEDKSNIKDRKKEEGGCFGCRSFCDEAEKLRSGPTPRRGAGTITLPRRDRLSHCTHD